MIKKFVGISLVLFSVAILYMSYTGKLLNQLILAFIGGLLLLDIYIVQRNFNVPEIRYRFPLYFIIFIFAIFISYLLIKIRTLTGENLMHLSDIRLSFIILIASIFLVYLISIVYYNKVLK